MSLFKLFFKYLAFLIGFKKFEIFENVDGVSSTGNLCFATFMSNVCLCCFEVQV